MPYKSTKDLPARQVRRYSEKGKRAFREAFNRSVYDEKKSEASAFRVAHHAAKRATGKRRTKKRGK